MQLTMTKQWGQSKISCPECGSSCLTNDEELTCINCDWECERDSPEGRRLINRHYA